MLEIGKVYELKGDQKVEILEQIFTSQASTQFYKAKRITKNGKTFEDIVDEYEIMTDQKKPN